MKDFYILFNGPPRSGKDEAKLVVRSLLYQYFNKEDISPHIMSFSTVLQKAVPALYGIQQDEWDERYNSDMKDEPWKRLFGFSQRQALIQLSEDYLKKQHGCNVFAMIMTNLVANIKSQYGDMKNNIFLMDTGFNAEFAMFVDYVGKDNCLLVKVYRPGSDFSNDSRRYIDAVYHQGVDTLISVNSKGLDEWRSTVTDSIMPIIESKLI
jgi:hypothetical protein